MKRQYIEQLKKGITELVLLYLIGEVPTYGYNIIKELEKRTTGYFKVKGGTIYPALQRLETKRLVKSRYQQITERQGRKYYQITEQGQQFLTKRLAEWKDFSAVVSALMGMSNREEFMPPKVA
jgi:PadR family transcriptional regulator PadR